MEMPKATDADKDYFRSLVEVRPELEIKPMFGQLAAFVASNSQMCVGLFGEGIGVRLGEAEREELMAIDGAGPFGPPDRPMKEYVTMPLAWRDGPESLAAEWIDRSIGHTSTLSPKKKKPSKRKPA